MDDFYEIYTVLHIYLKIEFQSEDGDLCKKMDLSSGYCHYRWIIYLVLMNMKVLYYVDESMQHPFIWLNDI